MLEPATSGIWTRFSSRSTALLITSDEPLIRTALCSTSLCSHGGIDSRPYVSSPGAAGYGTSSSARDHYR